MMWRMDALYVRITRMEPTHSSCVHIFTTHFYTTLFVEGLAAVSNWTTKKRINIFTKRMIFIPVHQDMHWSLCVVVNPGLVKLYHEFESCSLSVS